MSPNRLLREYISRTVNKGRILLRNHILGRKELRGRNAWITKQNQLCLSLLLTLFKEVSTMKRRSLLAMILSLVMCLGIVMPAWVNDYDPNNNRARSLLLIHTVGKNLRKKHTLL